MHVLSYALGSCLLRLCWWVAELLQVFVNAQCYGDKEQFGVDMTVVRRGDIIGTLCLPRNSGKK
jgi:hypothetical protein